MPTREQVNTDDAQSLAGKTISQFSMTGGTLTASALDGCVATAPVNPNDLATKDYVDGSGGGVTPGSVLVNCETSAQPTADEQIADKKYVDDAVAAAFAAILPSVTIGTPIVLNPLVTPTVITQAHGLAGLPTCVTAVLECLVADGGFAVGALIFVDASKMPADFGIDGGITILQDSTNIKLIVGSRVYGLIEGASAGATFILTNASWKLTITPYKW